MRLLGFDLKDRVQRRRFIVLAVISNTLCLLFVAHELFLGEYLFDKEKKATIDPKAVSAVVIGAGSWKWPDAEWQFTQHERLRLEDRTDVEDFCRTLGMLDAKYIDNIRPMNNWVEMDIVAADQSDERAVIKENYQHEIFLELDGHTYEATPLKDWLRQVALKHQ
ncbi:MAG: hypothetical protein IPM12_09345 [Flavobacteriales bacterium]|nr:hypothetical protein [Flavobacteriales bacterium]